MGKYFNPNKLSPLIPLRFQNIKKQKPRQIPSSRNEQRD